MNNIQQELETLCTELDEYYSLRREVIVKHEDLTTREAGRAWELHDLLADKIGALKNLISDATGIPQTGQEDLWMHAMSYIPTPLVVSSLDQIIQATSLALGKIKRDIRVGKRDPQTGELLDKSGVTKSEPPKAFIAHGGRSGILVKLREFIEALGIEPVIVELSPTRGMTVDEKVNKYIKDADCGIVLATKGGIVDTTGMKPKQHPRLNVIDELERLRAAFPEKTILLVERGVDLPSNISGLTYEPFVRQSMDRAFTAIARELVEFGILTPTRP